MRRFGPLLTEPVYRRTQRANPTGDDIPEYVVVDPEIAVDQNVAQRNDLRPLDVRRPATNLGRNLPRRLAEQLDVTHDGVLNEAVLAEVLATDAGGIARDPVACRTYIADIHAPVTRHGSPPVRRLGEFRVATPCP